MISENFSLNDTTPVKIISKVDMYQQVYIHNNTGGAVYVGGSNVTSTSGYHLANHEHVAMEIPQQNELFGIKGSGTGDIVIVRPD